MFSFEQEVAECLKEIQSPSRHHVFVEVTLNHTMEKRTSERQLTGKLIHFLLRDGVLTAQQYLDGYMFREFALCVFARVS